MASISEQSRNILVLVDVSNDIVARGVVVRMLCGAELAGNPQNPICTNRKLDGHLL